jgi:creatinine amidohydrolase
MPHRTLLAEMTREQIRAIAPTTTVVLPTAAIEQHGPHLPIVTDTLACTTICQRAAELASAEGTPVTVAPPVHFGASHHHRPYPGVLSLSLTTFVQVVKEICESLALSGFRRIAIVNGHGGNDAAIRVAATDVSLAHPVSVAAASYWTIAAAGLIEDGRVREVGQLPGHAGGFETSLVLALGADLVDRASYPPALGAGRPYPADMAQRATVIREGGSIGAGPGYTDDPSGASAEHGQHLLGIITRELARFLVEFSRQ